MSSLDLKFLHNIQIHLKILANFVSQAKFGLRYFVKFDGKFVKFTPKPATLCVSKAMSHPKSVVGGGGLKGVGSDFAIQAPTPFTTK